MKKQTFLLIVYFVSLPPLAHAESGVTGPRTASLLLPTCDPPPFSVEEVLSILRVELLSAGVTLGPRGEGAHALFIVDSPDCSPLELFVRLEHSVTSRTTEERLDLADRPVGDRGRVLALALAELLRARWAELSEQRDQEPPEPTERSVEPETETLNIDALRTAVVDDVFEELLEREDAQPRPGFRRFGLGAALSTNIFPKVNGTLIGARLLFSVALSREIPLQLVIDGSFGHGGGSARRGDVVTWSATGGLALLYVFDRDRFQGAIGPSLELGYAKTEGRTTLPDVGTGEGGTLIVDLGALLEVSFLFTSWAGIFGGLALGYMVKGLVPLSEGYEVGGVAGPSVKLEIGMRFFF